MIFWFAELEFFADFLFIPIGMIIQMISEFFEKARFLTTPTVHGDLYRLGIQPFWYSSHGKRTTLVYLARKIHHFGQSLSPILFQTNQFG